MCCGFHRKKHVFPDLSVQFVQFLAISAIKCAEIPTGAIESTDELMEHEKITDKIDDMTDETSESDSGSVVKAISVLSSRDQPLPDM